MQLVNLSNERYDIVIDTARFAGMSGIVLFLMCREDKQKPASSTFSSSLPCSPLFVAEKPYLTQNMQLL